MPTSMKLVFVHYEIMFEWMLIIYVIGCVDMNC